MSQKIEGFFLRSTKLKQNVLLVDLYTFQHGRSSFIFTHQKKSPFIFQPFHFFSFQSNYNPEKKLNRANNQELIFPVINIVSDVRKTGLAILITEILNKCINNFEVSPSLYVHIKKMIISFEHHDFNPVFGIFFVKEILHFFGINPQNNYDEKSPFFNISNGRFESKKDDFLKTNFPHKEFHELLGMNVDTIFDMKLSVDKRREILALLLEYLSYHEILNQKQIQSVHVLQSIYD